MGTLSSPASTLGWDWDRVPGLPRTHYLDNRMYTDEALFNDEKEKIFKAQWKFACHESEVPEPGGYRVINVADTAVAIIRGADNILRAFLNICPHRGAKLLRDVQGTIKGDRTTCFYHHWTFTTAGQCTTIPLPQGYSNEEINADNVHLKAVNLESLHGLIFVNLSSSPSQTLKDFLGSAMEQIEAPLSDLEVFHYHRVVVKANWKLFVETNCEGYHELLHLLNRTTALSQPSYLQRKWLLHPNGHHTFQPANIAYNKLKLGDRGTDTLNGMTPNMHVVTDLFPDVMINVRSTVVRIDSLIPVEPGLTILECRGLGPKSDTETQRRARVKQHNQVWGPMGRNLPEDIWAIETQWANMTAHEYPYSLVAREDNDQATDDSPVRSFYAKWQELTGVSSFDIHAPFKNGVAHEQ
jgi:methanesulfonate monooxygenase large subunit